MAEKRNLRLFSPPMRVSHVLAMATVALVLCAVVFEFVHRSTPDESAQPSTFVGSNACRSCHSAEAGEWSRSHDSGAMAEASDSTVLGNFANASLHAGDGTSSFFKRDGKFFVRTDGADGKLGEFEIRYTFGVRPLQQYLIALPGGRLQALTLAWDTRAARDGGQRWFPLYPDSRSSADELHWARPAQNWNSMCADCHSTGVRKNYNVAADSFHTTWSEISVGCEACHGPGSRHVTWAANRGRSRDSTMGLTVRLDERHGVAWTVAATTGNAARSHPRTTDRELQVCAQCHSRRAQIADGYTAGKAYYDYYRPALLSRPLYHADGQQRGEVYEWGSFLQSRMNARGVTCSDCHNPHSGELRARGNALCARCHAAEKYDTVAHDHHAAARDRVTCVSCHMPAATYMQVDSRRDHGFRIPRPDLTVTLGTPNACASCHADRGARWAENRIAAWRSGDTSALGFQRFARAFAAAERGRGSDAQRELNAVASDTTQPPIARATALAELTATVDRGSLDVLSRGLDDRNPIVRLGALRGATSLPPAQRAPLLVPLLSDSMTAIRAEASRLQAGLGFRSSAEQAAFERAASDFVAVQQYNADRADARTNLGTLYAELGDLARGEKELREAIRLDSFFSPAYVNLADILKAGTSPRDAEGERVLREGLSRVPADAGLHHALGLALVRLRRADEARSEFRQAAALDPLDVRFGYVYAVSLYSGGRAKEAIAELERVLAVNPNDRDVIAALAIYRSRPTMPAGRRH